jgi:hypothetical protein
MSAYSNQAPFDPSMLVHFRERIDMNLDSKRLFTLSPVTYYGSAEGIEIALIYSIVK